MQKSRQTDHKPLLHSMYRPSRGGVNRNAVSSMHGREVARGPSPLHRFNYSILARTLRNMGKLNSLHPRGDIAPGRMKYDGAGHQEAFGLTLKGGFPKSGSTPAAT